MMRRFLAVVQGASMFLGVLAGLALAGLMGLTVLDVVLRAFRRPIVGTYELVALMGALAIGLALPITAWRRSHINVDFLIGAFPVKVRNGFNIATRLLGIAFFFLAGWNLFLVARNLKEVGEVSSTLQIPFYPVAYAIGVSCFVLCVVLLTNIVQVWRGEYE